MVGDSIREHRDDQESRYQAERGDDHSVWTLFAVPPVAALVLGLLNGYRPLRAIVLAVAALVMIGVWYALLFLPAAALCSRCIAVAACRPRRHTRAIVR